jgi:hypothetical protein
VPMARKGLLFAMTLLLREFFSERTLGFISIRKVCTILFAE